MIILLLDSIIYKQYSSNFRYIAGTLLLGFVAYGLSIFFYIKAQRNLGAARTSTYYAAAPFIGVVISWFIFQDVITVQFLIALAIMLLGCFFAISEVHYHTHFHVSVIHEHKHSHLDEHHIHSHDPEYIGEHSHIHTHEAMEHSHPHTPDMHHNHNHKQKLK